MTSDVLRHRVLLTWYLIGLLVLLYVALLVLSHVHLVVSLLIVSTLAAYLLNPLVNFFSEPMELWIPREVELPWLRIPVSPREICVPLLRRGLPRWAAILVVYALLAMAGGVALTFVIPVVSQEFDNLVANLGNLLDNLEANLAQAVTWVHDRVPPFLQSQFSPETIRVESLLDGLQNDLPNMLTSTATGVYSGVKAAAGVVGTALLVPLMTFYILIDVGRFRRGFMRLVPTGRRRDMGRILSRIDQSLGRYIRGQIVVCFVVGISVTIVLNLLRVEYALLIGLFAGVMELIPYVGVAVGLVPAFLISLVNQGFLWALLVVLCLEALHWLEGHTIVPAVIGTSVGLSPLIVLLALLIGFELGGILGMFVAIPSAAIVRVLIDAYAERLEREREPVISRTDLTREVTF